MRAVFSDPIPFLEYSCVAYRLTPLRPGIYELLDVYEVGRIISRIAGIAIFVPIFVGDSFSERS
jgi:hypothetical protein